jgi:hypothetical protein
MFCGGDACGHRNPLGGIIVGTFSALGLQVKILDNFDLNDGGALHRYPWVSFFVFGGKFYFFMYHFFVYLSFDL